MNENVPFIWRAIYGNEATLPEKVREISQKKARQHLEEHLSRILARKAK